MPREALQGRNALPESSRETATRNLPHGLGVPRCPTALQKLRAGQRGLRESEGCLRGLNLGGREAWVGCEAGDPDGPTASAGTEPGRRPGQASSGRGGRGLVGTARRESERAGGSHEHRTRGAPGRPEGPDRPKAPGGGRARPDAGHPLQSHRPAAPRVRTTAPAALDGTGAGGQGGRRARPARRRGNAILPLEPPGQWGLREGALAAQEFRGRGAGSLADGASARARRRSGRPRPPHPVVARARRPLVRRPARPRDPLGVGPEGDAVPARPPARRSPHPP